MFACESHGEMILIRGQSITQSQQVHMVPAFSGAFGKFTLALDQTQMKAGLQNCEALGFYNHCH